ncbi:MAG: T9SS type A sorting domain-containing protein [Chlorobi bacterium]|nr:T9SS type A sorting domain-containing protein [Chlorobiota bacterium]MCI0716421.1 T9SS type A sorting domain-containing protein [Chlorobiota bacterium]
MQDTRLNNNYEIWYKRSTTSGSSWGPDVRLIFPSGFYTWNPSIAAQGNIVHLVWGDGRNGNLEIYYSRSGNRGVFWSPEVRLTNAAGESNGASLVMSQPYVHLVWQDSRNGTSEIYYKRLNDNTGWESDTRLTNNSILDQIPSIAVSNSQLHVAWSADVDGTEIYYKRNPTGNPVGITSINSEIPGEFSLEQNYPNPFNPKTIINFQLPSSNSGSNYVTLKIYDMTGREVSTLVNQQLNAGSYSVDFDGSGLSSGVYFYRLHAGGFSDVKKMNLVK